MGGSPRLPKSRRSRCASSESPVRNGAVLPPPIIPVKPCAGEIVGAARIRSWNGPVESYPSAVRCGELPDPISALTLFPFVAHESQDIHMVSGSNGKQYVTSVGNSQHSACAYEREIRIDRIRESRAGGAEVPVLEALIRTFPNSPCDLTRYILLPES